MTAFRSNDSVITLTDAMVTDAMGDPVVLAKGTAGTVDSISLPGGNVVVAFPQVRTTVHYKPHELCALPNPDGGR